MSTSESYLTGRLDPLPIMLPSAKHSRFVARANAHPMIEPKQNRLLSDLPAAEQAQLKLRLQLVRWEPGDTIYRPDEFIESVYFPTTAVASRLAVLEDGSTVEIGMTGNDGVLGIGAFMASGRTENWTVVDIGGEAWRLRVGGLREAMNQSRGLSARLTSYYQDFFRQITQRAVCRSRHTIIEQLCTWLLMMRDRSETAALTLTQEVIARRLGARRAGITVAANTLRKAGAIAYRRGNIEVTDRGVLELKACECYGALRNYTSRYAISHPTIGVGQPITRVSTAA
jgi:CRP-like cAMP-binding protein